MCTMLQDIKTLDNFFILIHPVMKFKFKYLKSHSFLLKYTNFFLISYIDINN